MLQKYLSSLLVLCSLTILLSQSVVYAEPPVASTLISPSGSIDTQLPIFRWESVTEATWYYLWVKDGNNTVTKQWHRSSDVCDSGSECSVGLSSPISNGTVQWWVQTWSADGYGPWSLPLSFLVGGSLPDTATLASPQGSSSEVSPSYIWNAVSNATWYYLWVNDSTGNPIRTWFRAEELGCESGTCTATPAVNLAEGAAQWWVQTWNSIGYGAWSSPMAFSVDAGSSNVIPAPIYQDAAGIPPLSSVWHGSMGEHPVERITINHPQYPSPIPNAYKNSGWPAHYPDERFYYSHDDNVQLTVDLFRPADVSGELPTVFFISGWHHYHAEQYYSLFYFIASHGFNVVFVPYQDTDLSAANADVLNTIVADSQFAGKVDTSRVGFMGHSLGGNGLFNLTNGLANWGQQGRFIFMMATGSGSGPTVDVPINTQLIVQTYNERINDRSNDWDTDPRTSVDAIHATHGIPDSEKTFNYLPGDVNHQSSHSTPKSRYIDGKFYYDALEQVGIYRPLESLMRYAFNGDTQWKHLGLPNDTPAMQIVDDPATPDIDNDYQFNRQLNNIGFYSADRPYVDLDLVSDLTSQYRWLFTGITLSTDKLTYSPNESFTISLEKMPDVNEGGLGVYNHDGNVALQWVDANALNDGEIVFDGLPVGDYEVRVFTSNGNAPVRARVAFTVASP